VVVVSGSPRLWNVLSCLKVCCFLRNRAWLTVTTVVQAEAAAKKALLDAKDTMRENRKRKNSSKNTSKSPQLLVTVLCLANCSLANKADKAAAVAAGAAKKKKQKRTR
jgi:hypothetical protein